MKNSLPDTYAPFTNYYVFNHVLIENPDIAFQIIRMAAKDYLDNIVLEHMRFNHEAVLDPSRDQRHVRFDVMLSDEHNLIDLEMQNRQQDDLSDRVRYYLDASNLSWLKPGEPFCALPNTILIVICKFDASKKNLERFEVKETADASRSEHPVSMKWNSRYVNIFLSSSVPHTNNTALGRFLEYVETGKVSDELTRRIDEEVRRINTAQLGGIMTLEQIIDDERYDARKQAIQEGKATGILEGMERGKEAGIADEKRAAKAVLYRTLLNTGMSEPQARNTADKAYPGIPLVL